MKRFIAVLTAFCLVFAASCSQKAENSPGVTDTPSATTVPAEQTNKNSDQGVETTNAPEVTQSAEASQPTIAPAEKKYIGKIDVSGMPEKTLANKKVTVYCWSEYVPEKLHDWEGFRFTDYYGGEVETIVSTGDYYEDLYKLIAAGDIPDIVVAEAKSFPMFIMKDFVQPWDNYIDYDDPVWEQTGAKDTIEQLRWNGSIYNLSSKAHLLAVMYYNKRIISECGLEDPYEVWKRGEWNWDTFKKYLEATTYDEDGDGTMDVNGLAVSYDFLTAFVASTGEEHIEFDGTNFINNMKSQKVRDAADFLYSIGVNGSGLVNMGNFVANFITGKAAFTYTNDYRGYVDFSKMWGRDGLGIVPMPSYPGADQPYQAALADNLWLMKGAKNPEGAGLLALSRQYDALLNKNPDYSTDREGKIQDWLDHGFTQEAAEACADISEMPLKVLYSRAIFFKDGAIESRMMDYPWTTLADSAYGEVDKALKDATTPVSK